MTVRGAHGSVASMKNSRKGLIYVLLAAVFWSLAGIGIGAVHAPALAITGWRALFASPVFLLVLGARLRGLSGEKRARLVLNPWVLLGALSYLGTVVCFVVANKLVGSANAILLQYTAPVFVALLSFPLLRERPRIIDGLAAVGCFIGMTFFFSGELSSDGFLGNGIAIVSGVFFAFLALFLRKAALSVEGDERTAGLLALTTTALGNALTVFVALPAVISAGMLPLQEMLVLLGLGVVQIGLAYVLYSEGVVHLRAVVACVLVALEPILNPVWVALLTGEIPSRSSLLGGALILGTVLCYGVAQTVQGQRDRGRENARAKAAGIGPGAGIVLVFVTLGIASSARADANLDCQGSFESLAALQDREALEGHAENERTKIFVAWGKKTTPGTNETAVPKPRGVAVVAHGLNLLPSRMDALANVLAESGYTVVRAALSGHGGNLATYRKVTRGRFLGDMHAAVCAGDSMAREKGIPLVLVAYSLGALVAQDLVNTPAFTRSPFASQVLFAPAITVKAFTQTVRALSFAPWLQLPSLGFDGYKAASGATIAAYNALFDARSALLDGTLAHSRVPTLVFMNEGDELVSMSGLRDFIKDRELTTWTLEAIDKSGHSQPWRMNHMVIDSASMAATEWARVTQRMLGFLP